MRAQHLFAILISVVLSFACLSPTLSNGWVNWDDGGYVLSNDLVKQGVSFKTAAEMFTTPELVGSYHPLTLISLAMNYEIGGKSPFGFHLTNLLLHLLNVMLAYWLIFLLCKNMGVAVFVAVLFGIHPMHVESVAWISERKDVLYAFFFLLSLIFYSFYLKNDTSKKWLFYVSCLFLFTLSLLSKAMAITLPLILPLFDYLHSRKVSAKMFIEKVPFFCLSILFGLTGIAAQQSGNAMDHVGDAPVYQTIFVGSFSLFLYLVKSLIPFQLSAFHPFPFGHISEIPWFFYASILPITALLFLIWKLRKSNKTVVFGFLFFIICIAPVLQVLPFGRAMIAERYTYIPYIGLFYLAGIGLLRFWNCRDSFVSKFRLPVMGLVIVFFFALGLTSFKRSAVWKNGETLWTDVLKKYPTSYFAYSSLGGYFLQKGDLEKALANVNQSIGLFPFEPDTYIERGRIYQKQNLPDFAFVDYTKAIEINPTKHVAYLNRSVIFATNYDDLTSALKDLETAISIKPNYVEAHLNRGVIFEKMGRFDEAIEAYKAGIKQSPNQASLYRYRGVAHFATQNLEAAISDFSSAINLNSDYAEAYFLRSKVYFEKGELAKALDDALKAKYLKYQIEEAYLELLKTRVKQEVLEN
jgi:tetratricopeptide (TPR) repeat protein